MNKKNEKEYPNLLKILNSLNQRLTVLEQIVAERGEGKLIHQKIRLPTHDLQNSAKLMTDAGIADVVNIPVCSVCHGSMEEDGHFFVCHTCGCILCDVHAIILNNRAHCEEASEEITSTFPVGTTRR